MADSTNTPDPVITDRPDPVATSPGTPTQPITIPPVPDIGQFATATRNAPIHVELNVLKLVCTYLLYERGEETQLQTAFRALVQQRHEHFHLDPNDPNPASTFDQCTNPICVNSVAILAECRSQSVTLNEFMIRLMGEFGIIYTPGGGQITVRLVKRGEQPRIVLPG
jgi:hypothetical protein